MAVSFLVDFGFNVSSSRSFDEHGSCQERSPSKRLGKEDLGNAGTKNPPTELATTARSAGSPAYGFVHATMCAGASKITSPDAVTKERSTDSAWSKTRWI